MEIELICKFALLLASVFVGYLGGYLFTETELALSQFKLFQFKAFECRPCLSFHIAWIASTFFSLALNDFVMLAVGIIFAFALWIGLKVDQRERTVSIDDFDTHA